MAIDSLKTHLSQLAGALAPCALAAIAFAATACCSSEPAALPRLALLGRPCYRFDAADVYATDPGNAEEAASLAARARSALATTSTTTPRARISILVAEHEQPFPLSNAELTFYALEVGEARRQGSEVPSSEHLRARWAELNEATASAGVAPEVVVGLRFGVIDLRARSPMVPDVPRGPETPRWLYVLPSAELRNTSLSRMVGASWDSSPLPAPLRVLGLPFLSGAVDEADEEYLRSIQHALEHAYRGHWAAAPLPWAQ